MARRLSARRLDVLAAEHDIKVPTGPTLKRYGLERRDWLQLLADQDWVCAVCQRHVEAWNTDHEHVPAWKRLPPEQRRLYVRGVLCIHCNYRKVPSRMDGVEARHVATYIERYEARRDTATASLALAHPPSEGRPKTARKPAPSLKTGRGRA